MSRIRCRITLRATPATLSRNFCATLSGKPERQLWADPVEPGRWSQAGGVNRPGRPGIRPDPDPARPRPLLGRARQAPVSCRLASRLGLQAALNAQTEGCVSRRDLRLATLRQGEQGRRGGHVPGLRPPDHRSATTGARDLSRPRNRPRPSGAAARRSPRQSRRWSRRRHRGYRPDHAAGRDAMPADSPTPTCIPLYPFSALLVSDLDRPFCHCLVQLNSSTAPPASWASKS